MARPTREQRELASEEVKRQLAELAASVGCLAEFQVAFLAGVTTSTLMAWRKAGTGPRWGRIGNEVLYPKRHLQKWLEERADSKVAREADLEVAL